MIAQERASDGDSFASSLQTQQNRAGFLVPMDMTEILEFDQMLGQISTINHMNGAFYMEQFLRAKELASSYFCKAVFEYEQVRDEVKKRAAIAYLEKAPSALEKTGRKPTDEACKRFVEMDEEYLQSRQKEAYYKSLTEFLRQKMEAFQAAHDDAKAIYRGSTEPFGGRSALPSGKDAQ
jgi:hypothetical protein